MSCNAQHSNRSGEGTEDQWSPFLTIPLLGCLDENDKAKVCYHSFLPLESLDVIYVLSDMLLDSGSHFDSFSKFFFAPYHQPQVQTEKQSTCLSNSALRAPEFGRARCPGEKALVKSDRDSRTSNDSYV